MDGPGFVGNSTIIEFGGRPDSPDCEHPALRPCWDETPEHGLAGFITSYWCDTCGTPFTPAEAEQVRLQRRRAA